MSWTEGIGGSRPSAEESMGSGGQEGDLFVCVPVYVCGGFMCVSE